MNIDDMEWQYAGDNNEWNFGPKVRGLVRKVADIYYDEDRSPSWRWRTYVGNRVSGYCHMFYDAVNDVEKVISEVQE